MSKVFHQSCILYDNLKILKESCCWALFELFWPCLALFWPHLDLLFYKNEYFSAQPQSDS